MPRHPRARVILVPRAAVLACPLHDLEVAAHRRLRAHARLVQDTSPKAVLQGAEHPSAASRHLVLVFSFLCHALSHQRRPASNGSPLEQGLGQRDPAAWLLRGFDAMSRGCPKVTTRVSDSRAESKTARVRLRVRVRVKIPPASSASELMCARAVIRVAPEVVTGVSSRAGLFPSSAWSHPKPIHVNRLFLLLATAHARSRCGRQRARPRACRGGDARVEPRGDRRVVPATAYAWRSAHPPTFGGTSIASTPGTARRAARSRPRRPLRSRARPCRRRSRNARAWASLPRPRPTPPRARPRSRRG